jgi:hypothetical protein
MSRVRGGQQFMAELGDIGRRLGGPRVVRIGFLANATYPDGKSVAMIAAIQNYGAPRANIPPRPFFSNMIQKKKKEWPKAIADLLVSSHYNVDRTLRLTGEAIAGQLRESIIETNSPPLAAYTLSKRGVPGMKYNPKNPKTFRAKPLVDTGHMLNSVDYEVTDRST